MEKRTLGCHLIAELYFKKDSDCLINEQSVSNLLKEAAKQAGATVLGSFSHGFGFRCGFTAAVILGESHITVHTWPEHNYMALDIFMCYSASASKALDYLLASLEPCDVATNLIERGPARAAAPE